MDSALASLLLTFIMAMHVQLPIWIVKRLGLMQRQLDHFLLENDSCRSGYDKAETEFLMFAPRDQQMCPFRRGDFAAPGTTGQWPYAICTLIEAQDHFYKEEGPHPCDYP